MQFTISFNHFLTACLLITVIILAVAILMLALSARKTFEKIDVLVEISTEITNTAKATINSISEKVEEQAVVIEKVITAVAVGMFAKKFVDVAKSMKRMSDTIIAAKGNKGNKGNNDRKSNRMRRKRGRN